ncbi:MAG: hypothetical protein J0I20_34760 [Chloroflexi bacterium]|nr:hypothetical protein [Chloroflexota bacterium]OJV89748.1 MAG: hypothetical protein BGO39_28810 [Chloroflexi bacterium 54-19]
MENLEKLSREVWGAYEYLRDTDLSTVSGTSRLLRSSNRHKLHDRMVEELVELRGVVEGTHFHEGFAHDLILEGNEVWYWGTCTAINAGMDYESLLPHRALQTGYDTDPVSRPELVPVFDKLLKKLDGPQSHDDELANLVQVFCLVGRACRLNEMPPDRLLEQDKTEMSQKDYLANYWKRPAPLLSR